MLLLPCLALRCFPTSFGLACDPLCFPTLFDRVFLGFELLMRPIDSHSGSDASLTRPVVPPVAVALPAIALAAVEAVAARYMRILVHASC